MSRTCGTCRWCRPFSGGELGSGHQCHGAPPVMMFMPGGQVGLGGQVAADGRIALEGRVSQDPILKTFFPVVRTDNPAFFCRSHEGRGWIAAVLRFVRGR